MSNAAPALHRILSTRWLWPWLLRVAAVAWLIPAAVAVDRHFHEETAVGLTANGTLALGDDFISFWSGAKLAVAGRLGDIFDLTKFHQFEVAALGGPIYLYHYGYPPIMILLSLPFALLPYVAALAVWMLGGAVLFALTVRAAWPGMARPRGDAVLYALAMPAVLLNTLTGQNGTWTASLLGGGLMAVGRWPVLGGAMLGVLAAKPQMAMLVPVALLAGRRWTALLAFCGAVAGLTAASLLLFGFDIWWDFVARLALLRRFMLEDGTGVWQLFVSVFVTVRHLPAPVAVAYAVQALAAGVALVAVAHAWLRPAPQVAQNAVLVMAVFFVTPYVQVYDLVVAMLVPLWLSTVLPAGPPARQMYVLSWVPLILAPIVAPYVSVLTGFGIGCLMLMPAFAVAVDACGRGRTPELRGSGRSSDDRAAALA